MSETTKQLRGNEYLVTHSVGSRQHGVRLDRFLMDRYTKRSREQIKRAIDSGAVTIARNGPKHLNLGRIKASVALYPGDIVSVLSVRKYEPEVNFDYKILFEDEHLAIIEKPPNLPVHPAGRFFFHTLLVHLKTQGFKVDLETERKFFLVHRIDKETSGVLLLAKTKEACNLLTAQFRNRDTEKYYLALVKGVPAQKEFVVDTPIGKSAKNRIGLKMYPTPIENGGLESFTTFKVLESRGDYSLLACYPKTGRQHQIRAHAEIAGHPLVGDKVYGLTEEDVLILLEGHRELQDELQSEASPEPAEDIATEAEQETDDHLQPEPGLSDSGGTRRFEIPGPTSSRVAEIEARLLLPRHALHAAGLKFNHPITNQRMEFNSPLPADLQSFFDRQVSF
ncbi:MAG: RluA family pseudouridine synthase [Bdellovibrionales bacterium]|nr:RluA family pseudouridine synthase [Bdellovibrionales bacterium]